MLLLCPLAVTAAENPPPEAGDAAARIASLLRKLDSTRGQFRQERRLAGIAYPIVSRGRFIYRRDRGLYWETTEPFFNASTFTPEGIVHWRSRGVPAQSNLKNTRVEEEISRILLSVFSADLERIRERFSVSATLSRPSDWLLTLTPSGAAVKHVIDHITVSGDREVHAISIAAAGGDNTTITLTGTGTDAPLSPEECRFFAAGADCRPL